MNKEQFKFIAEVIKTIAFAEFGYYGYTGLQAHDFALVFVAAIGFFGLVGVAVMVLGCAEEDAPHDSSAMPDDSSQQENAYHEQ